MSVERQAVAGLKWSAAGKLLAQAFSWAVTLIVLRILSPDDYGLVALGMVLITTIGAIAEAGLGASMVQARDVSRDELARLAGTLVVVHVACMLMLMLAAPLIADLFGASALTNVIRVCSLQFLLNAIDAVPQSMAARQMNFRFLAMLDFIAAFVTSATTLSLALAGAGLWALVLGTLTGGAVRTLLLVTRGTAVWPHFAMHGMGRHFRFGGAVTIGRVLWQFAHQFDLMVAGRALDKHSVGLYAVVMQLATLPMQKTMGIVNQVAFPAIARLQDELARLRTRLLDAVRLLSFAALPALWGIAAVAPEIVDLLLDERWHDATVPLQLAGLIAPLRMLAALLSTALAGVGRADLDLRNSIVTFIVFPIAFAVGAYSAGLHGLAGAWLVAVPLVFGFNWPRTRNALGIDAMGLITAARAPLAAAGAMVLAVIGMRLAIADVSSAMRLPVLIGVGAAVYLGLVGLLDRSLWHDLRRFASALR